MAGYPGQARPGVAGGTAVTHIVVASRTLAKQIVRTPELRADLLERVAEGYSLGKIAKMHGIEPVIFYRVVMQAMRDEVRAAREVYAEQLVEKNLELADEVQEGRVAGTDAKVAAGIRQWYAERAASEEWGQKSTTNVNIKGVVGLHFEAIKQLNALGDPDEALDAVDAEDADFEEISGGQSAPSDISNHPLL